MRCRTETKVERNLGSDVMHLKRRRTERPVGCEGREERKGSEKVVGEVPVRSVRLDLLSVEGQDAGAGRLGQGRKNLAAAKGASASLVPPLLPGFRTRACRESSTSIHPLSRRTSTTSTGPHSSPSRGNARLGLPLRPRTRSGHGSPLAYRRTIPRGRQRSAPFFCPNRPPSSQGCMQLGLHSRGK